MYSKEKSEEMCFSTCGFKKRSEIKCMVSLRCIVCYTFLTDTLFGRLKNKMY